MINVEISADSALWNPRKLWSLWDMIQFYAVFLCQVFEQFGTIIDGLLRRENQHELLGEDYKNGLSRHIAFDIIEQHRGVFLDDALASRAWHLRAQLGGSESFTPAMLAREMQGILAQMILALRYRKFAYIPPQNADYFEQEKLFGESVHAEFEEARDDIKDAGNSFAAGLYTACVFYLMRVAEYGLRNLAKTLSVTLTHTGNMIPIEYGEWDQIIIEANKKIPRPEVCPETSDENTNCNHIQRLISIVFS